MGKRMLKRASESDWAAELREAIGAGPDEPVSIVTPQFEREPGQPPATPPADWEALRTLDVQALKELGMRPWGCPEDAAGNEHPEAGCLWLFPGEWYPAIPNGFEIVDINFNAEVFVRGRTDDDIRFGCLSFGVLGPALPTNARESA